MSQLEEIEALTKEIIPAEWDCPTCGGVFWEDDGAKQKKVLHLLELLTTKEVIRLAQLGDRVLEILHSCPSTFAKGYKAIAAAAEELGFDYLQAPPAPGASKEGK